MVLFGFCLIKDRAGIKIAFRIRRFEVIKYLWKFPVKLAKTPVMEDPIMLTEVPTGRIFDVEDMDKEPVEVELIEPEDM